jgi:hypothetical protein
MQFFMEKLPVLFKLAFIKALKDPKNDPGWRAFKIGGNVNDNAGNEGEPEKPAMAG